MNILHVGPNSVHVTRFIDAFTGKDIHHYLLTDSEVEVQHAEAVLVLDFHSLNPLKIRKNLRLLRQFIQIVKPDVVHLHQVSRMAFWVSKVAKSLQIPIVVTAWGSDVLLMPQKNALYRFLVKTTLNRAEAITADAQSMIDAMQGLAPGKSYHWLQYGIEPIDSLPKQSIIYSNRLHNPNYNISEVIQLFADFVKDHPEWHLRIAATGSETEQLKAFVASNQLEAQVTFLGWLSNEENRTNYRDAAMYISIPKSDGTSVSLLEAMSAGCIPIVSDLPSNKEWITHLENGIVYQKGTNPFEQALQLNQNAVASINQHLIHEKATRQSSVEAFKAIYKMNSNEKQ